MRRAIQTAVLATLLCGVAPVALAATQLRCETRTPIQLRLEYDSIEQLPDRRVTFRLCAPDAVAVKLTSSELETEVPTGYDGKAFGLPMARDALGYWTVTTKGPVGPGNYRIAFNVDGIDMADPQGMHFSEDFRGVRSVFEVLGPETAFQSYRAGIPHGMVTSIEYPSTTIGAMRRAHVYTPPGYEGADAKRYPVLYLVHGAGDSDDSWTSSGHAHYILDNLIAAGKAKPMIIVMPFGHTPAREGVSRMLNTDFGGDLLKDLIPFIDGHYRTIPKASDRAMAGLSMGGAHTLYFGLVSPELFGSIGVFSMGIGPGDPSTAYVKDYDAALKMRAASKGPVFYAVGTEDRLIIASSPSTRKILDDYKIRYTYRESGGGHTWVNWRAYLNEFAPMLFR